MGAPQRPFPRAIAVCTLVDGETHTIPDLVWSGLKQIFFDIFSQLFLSSFCRAAHVTNLQIFYHDDCVVFADLCRDFMKVVAPRIGNFGCVHFFGRQIRSTDSVDDDWPSAALAPRK